MWIFLKDILTGGKLRISQWSAEALTRYLPVKKFHSFIKTHRALCKHGPLPSLPIRAYSHFLVILQVYGTTFHINRGNPFKLKALVDKWPDFNTVVIRPQEQVSGQMCSEYVFVFIFAVYLLCNWQYGRPWEYRNKSRWYSQHVLIFKTSTAWRRLWVNPKVNDSMVWNG